MLKRPFPTPKKRIPIMSDTYRIAGFDLHLLAPHFRFRGLEPFRLPAESPEEEPLLLALACDPATRTADPADRLLDTFDFPEANACCRLYRYGGGCLFVMTVAEGAAEVRFDLPDTGPDARCNFPAGGDPSLFRFGLWMAFNLRAAARGALAIHASAVVHRGEAVLCLGESGTGKSTHTRLWRETIEGAELLNDDSPILRIRDGAARVYGSPWSGKTPCYRNRSYPIRGFLRLRQAPENRIRPFNILQAYGALQPSLPPSFAHDAALFEAENALLSALLQQVRVYRLDCLPDAEAARLACRTLYDETR